MTAIGRMFAASLSSNTSLSRFEFTGDLQMRLSCLIYRLVGWRLQDDSATSIAAAMAKNKALTHLDLSNNPLTDEGEYNVPGVSNLVIAVLALCRGIKENATLQSLCLNKLALQPNNSACSYLRKTFCKYNTTLISLSMEGNNLNGLKGGMVSLVHLVIVVPFSCSLSVLIAQVIVHQLIVLTVENLAATVVEAGNWTVLQLSDCKLGNEGAAVLFQLINDNRKLQKLHINNNDISSIAGLALGANTNLVELFISGNPLGEAGIRHLAKEISFNRRLYSLSVARTGACKLLAGRLCQMLF
jgi:Ran GTPase-activating protein (RanGAP) involved in mRNA processing and transport